MALAGYAFGIVCLAHAWRFLSGATVVVAGHVLPLWLSAVAAVFAGYMSYQAFQQKH